MASLRISFRPCECAHALAELTLVVHQLTNRFVSLEATIVSTQAQLAADVAALTSQVEANTTAINGLAALITSDTATIADLAAQIAALKAAQPDLDLSGLEAATAQLAANNASATSLLPAPAPPPSAATA